MCPHSVPQPTADRDHHLERGVGDHVLERQVVLVEHHVRDVVLGVARHVRQHAVLERPDVVVAARGPEVVVLVALEGAHTRVPADVDALGVVVRGGAVAALGLRVVPLVGLARTAAAHVRLAGLEVDLAGQRVAGLQGVDGLGGPDVALVVARGVHGHLAERGERHVAERDHARAGLDHRGLGVAGVADLLAVDVDVHRLLHPVREDGVVEGDHLGRIGLGDALVGSVPLVGATVAGGISGAGGEGQGREGPAELGHVFSSRHKAALGTAFSNHFERSADIGSHKGMSNTPPSLPSCRVQGREVKSYTSRL